MKLATLCYLRRNGQTLMLYRNKKQNDVHEGKWNGLGGKFEPGESPEACAVREIEEESGLKARKPKLKGVLTFPGFSHDEDWYVFVYEVTEFDGQERESPEGHLEWIENSRVMELNLWEGDRMFLEWFNADRFFSGTFVYKDGRLVRHDVVFHD